MKIKLYSCLAMALVASGAQAQSTGFKVKLGVSAIKLDVKTPGLTGIGVPPGADVGVGDATTPTLDVLYALTPNISAELAIGIPPKHDTSGKGSVAFLGKTGSVKQFAPTFFVNYHFLDASSTIRPFAGLGVNYTKFFDATSTLGQDVQLSRSIGLAWQLGAEYAFDKRWSTSISVAGAKVKSNLVATATTVQRTTIDFRPIVYSVNLGYSF